MCNPAGSMLNVPVFVDFIHKYLLLFYYKLLLPAFPGMFFPRKKTARTFPCGPLFTIRPDRYSKSVSYNFLMSTRY